MDEKQAIISQILSSAEKTAKNIIDAAKTEQDNALAEKAALDEKKNEAALNRAIVTADENIKRFEMLANLDAKKYLLKTRQDAITHVYNLAEEKLISLQDDKYRKLFADLIGKFANDGDKISICDSDADRLNKEWLDRCAKEKNLHLTFGERHNHKGGIIILGDKCDINCTIEALVSDARVYTEKKVAEILFEENE